MPVLRLPRSDAPPYRARALVFEDPLSHELLTRIEQIAPTEATCLITGETGTGKEIVARHLHERSARAAAPFVAVNCGALTPSLLESELFGHEKAAFTGATSARAGWFEAAHGGTLFLDEIADLPLAAQVKLLRILQEREVVRVGSRRPIPIDVRLVAATNANLAHAVTEGRFREDLFYRLHVAHLTLAPLRDRPGDILPLARHFLAAYAPKEGAHFTPEAEAKLVAHRWPGNIRELENVVHHGLVVAKSGRVDADDLHLIVHAPLRVAAHAPARSLSMPPPPPIPVPTDPGSALEHALTALFEAGGAHLLRDIEAAVFRAAYEFSERNQLRTARLLGTSRNVVRARLLQYGLLTPSARDPEEAPAPSALTRKELRRVRIAEQPFGVLSLLKATGALEEALHAHSAEVQWIDCASGMQVMDALAVGALDLGVVGEVPPVFAQAARAPVVYLATEPPAPEGEAIVVREGAPLNTVADLRGKKLAVTRGSTVVYLVVRALEEVGLGLHDVDLRALSPAEAQAAFLDGAIDAWATWNPLLASIRRTSRVRVLRDARGIASNRAFYVARRSFADAHPAVVGAFLGQVGAVGRWANDSRLEAVRALAPHVDVSADALEDAFSCTRFDVQAIDAEALASQQSIADTFHRLRLITRAVRVGEALWTPPGSERRSA
jgi:aliphatic sulfonates family ABC transporter substrate-binding protein